MFRNLYLESYKKSISENSSLEIMMYHMNHIYSALGCIIQDIEFMAANMIAATKASQKVERERTSLPEKNQKMNLVMPKVEFLPSSSYKNDYTFTQNPRNNLNFQHAERSAQKCDSFEDMFPQPRKSNFNEMSEFSRESNSRGGKKQEVAEQSQQDFIDTLFMKKKK